ncbi:flagellin [Litorivicinus sp.]|nr:flagellin [Litorivicinus sp.]
MALVVNTNIPSISAQRQLTESRNDMETAMQRLSSGKRINSAADDAAGLAISTRMDSQIRGLNMAIKNANDGISTVQTAEGALQEVTDMLQRMRELALQSVNGSNSDDDRASLDAEVQQLKAEIDRISDNTSFNDRNILDGTFNQLFQIGDNAGDSLRLALGSVDTASLGMASNTEASTDVADMLVSARLASTFTFDPSSNTALSGMTSDGVTGISFAAGDIMINGQELAAFDGTSEDVYDLITNINDNVDNVDASAFNTVVAKTAGTGIVRSNQVSIQTGAIGTSTDAWYQAEKLVTLESSDSMAEMVANINAAFYENEVVATINDDGKLVLSNDSGAAIRLADVSGTDNAYDGATGFLVTTDVTISSGVPDGFGTGVQGFLKLSSTDETPIAIETGNAGLTSPGAVSDIQNIGFNMTEEDPTGNSYTVTGTRMTDALISATLGQNSSTEQADLTLNGVEIYDATLSAASNTFQGKLDLINAFSDETGVVASSYYEKTFDTSNWSLISGDTVDLNGTSITLSATVVSTVAAINAQSALTGVTAELDGSSVIIKGDGVENVTFEQNDYALTAATQASGRRSSDSGAQTQRIAFGAADIDVGRVLTMTFDQTAATDPDGTAPTPAGYLSMATTTSVTLSYTVASGDTAGDVATAFHDLLNTRALDVDLTTAFSANELVSLDASTGALVFQSILELGEATITLGVTQVAAANRIFYDGSADGGATANYTDHAALRLQSTDMSPISVEFSESGNELGLLENNVGDTTWDSNSATFQSTGTASVAVSGLSISTSSGAESALSVLSLAIQDISNMRSNLGAVENRLGHTVSNLANVVENTSAAQSRIQDADFALEAASLARAQILQQAGTAMLAQANAAPQNVLSLLG